MRRGGIGLAMVACLALGGAPVANAERITPELGRCVKAPKGEAGAGYSDSSCTTPVGAGAAYRWLAGPGAHPGFRASTGSVALTLESTGGKRAVPVIECAASSSAGEFTAAGEQSVDLVLSGCKMASASCQSAGAAAGEVAFSPLEGIPEVVRTTERGEAVMRWLPVLGETLASFECGGSEVTITESVLHAVRDDKMIASEPATFRVYKDGTQRPECAEPCGAGEEPATSIGGATASLSGFAMSGSQTDEERIELRTFM